MPNEALVEQATIPHTEQLRQFTDGLFQDVQGDNNTGFSQLRYVGGEKDHFIRFSRNDLNSSYRIEYINPALTVGGISGDKSFILDDKGVWDPSNDSAIGGSEEAESQHISQFLMDALKVSSAKPLNGLGRIALKLRSR